MVAGSALCCQSVLLGEGIEGFLVCGGGAAQVVVLGALGQACQAGGQEPVMDPGQEHGGVQAGVGQLVSMGVRETLDQAVQAQPAQARQ